jgi:hypothetical protein
VTAPDASAVNLRAAALAAITDTATTPEAAAAWVVGGAVRDEILGRPLLALDVACLAPEAPARAAARATGGAPFPLSERHGAWRVVLDDGRTLDFTPLAGTLADDLAQRDFTVNAIASPLAGGAPIDPHGGLPDLDAGVLRMVSAAALDADPVRLLRAVRFEDELGLAMDAATEAAVRERAALVTLPAGERLLAELRRLSPAGWRRLDAVGLLAALGGNTTVLPMEPARDGDPADLLLVAALGAALLRLPIANEQRRYATTLLRAEPPADLGPRAIHRFRHATEPWALDALLLLAARDATAPDAAALAAVTAARTADPAEPLLRGDELGLPPGPAIGRILDRIAEERAAGTITTRDDALALARREGAP